MNDARRRPACRLLRRRRARQTAALNGPYGLAIDGSGQLYIADTDNNRVRRVRAAGVIKTLGGTGILGFSGDAGPASAPSSLFPTALRSTPPVGS